MHIRVVDSVVATQAFNSFLIVLHAMNEQEVSVTFRSAAQHFEGGGSIAEMFWMGKRDLPGTWVGVGSAARVNCFVAILQLEKRMLKANFTRFLCTWLKKQGIPEKVIDTVVQQSRVFTTREAEAMGLRCVSVIDVDPEIRSDFERLRSLARPEDEQQSQELRKLLGKCTDWMDENDIPDEIYQLPVDELFDAVIQYSTSGGTSAAVPSDGLAVVDRNTVEICDAAPEGEHPTGPPTTYGPVGHETETPVLAGDSCDELERELVGRQAVAPPSDPAEQLRLQRRAHESSGYVLFRASVKMPGLTASHPKQRVTVDEAADVLVEQFRKKYGETGSGSFSTALLQIAGCFRDAVDEGRLAQKDRLSLILPVLTVAYKKLFERKAASISTGLKDEISRIVLRSKCKNCGGNFVPSDQSLYDSDANGVEVVVGKRNYDTRNFCEERCEQRWQCFRCRCGRPLQPGRFGLWINPRCSMCGVGRPVLGRLEMDNILSGLDRHHHVKQFYPRF
jgi:hypothetical protein